MDAVKVAAESKAWQSKWELEQLLRLVDPIKPDHIVEIGSYMGHGMATWDAAWHPRVLVGVDTEPQHGTLPYHVLTGDSSNPGVVDKVRNLVDGSVDFLFIDGDHSYDAVSRDFMMYSPMVRSGGIIALHDIHWDWKTNLHGRSVCGASWIGEVGVRRLWEEVNELYPSVQIWMLGAGPGTGILYV